MTKPVFSSGCFDAQDDYKSYLKLNDDGVIVTTDQKPTVQERYALNQRIAEIGKQLASKKRGAVANDLCQQIHNAGYEKAQILWTRLQTVNGRSYTAHDNDSWCPQTLLNLIRLIRIVVARILKRKPNEEDSLYFSKVNINTFTLNMHSQGLQPDARDIKNCKFECTNSPSDTFPISKMPFIALQSNLLDAIPFTVGHDSYYLTYDKKGDKVTLYPEKSERPTEKLDHIDPADGPADGWKFSVRIKQTLQEEGRVQILSKQKDFVKNGATLSGGFLAVVLEHNKWCEFTNQKTNKTVAFKISPKQETKA